MDTESPFTLSGRRVGADAALTIVKAGRPGIWSMIGFSSKLLPRRLCAD